MEYLRQEVEFIKNFIGKNIRKAGEILMNEPSATFELIHFFVSRSEGHLSILEMCRIAGVSRSGYYAWVKAIPICEAQEEQDRKDFDSILEAYQWRGYSKGARGI